MSTALIAPRFRRQYPIRRTTAVMVLGALVIHPLVGLAGSGKLEPQRSVLAVRPSGDAAPTVFDVRLERAGARCAGGGQLLLAGADRNANGALDPFEVEESVMFCNGVGPSGEPSGFRARPEPVSSVCPKGGKRYAWGYDDDGNGRLDQQEELFYVHACNATR